jgi:hypothetical protein
MLLLVSSLYRGEKIEEARLQHSNPKMKMRSHQENIKNRRSLCTDPVVSTSLAQISLRSMTDGVDLMPPTSA